MSQPVSYAPVPNRRPKFRGNHPVDTVLLFIIVLQASTGAAMLFLPFGFDHPSSLGLDFDHFVKIGLVYVGSLIAGAILSIMRRRFILLAIQLLAPIVVIGIQYLMFISQAPIGPDMSGT